MQPLIHPLFELLSNFAIWNEMKLSICWDSGCYSHANNYRGGMGLCLCVCYSAIFTKTNRISRKGLQHFLSNVITKIRCIWIFLAAQYATQSWICKYLTTGNIRSRLFERIFNNSTVGAQKPKWISPRSQVAICSGLVSIQVKFWSHTLSRGLKSPSASLYLSSFIGQKQNCFEEYIFCFS